MRLPLASHSFLHSCNSSKVTTVRTWFVAPAEVDLTTRVTLDFFFGGEAGMSVLVFVSSAPSLNSLFVYLKKVVVMSGRWQDCVKTDFRMGFWLVTLFLFAWKNAAFELLKCTKRRESIWKASTLTRFVRTRMMARKEKKRCMFLVKLLDWDLIEFFFVAWTKFFFWEILNRYESLSFS